MDPGVLEEDGLLGRGEGLQDRKSSPEEFADPVEVAGVPGGLAGEADRLDVLDRQFGCLEVVGGDQENVDRLLVAVQSLEQHALVLAGEAEPVRMRVLGCLCQQGVDLRQSGLQLAKRSISINQYAASLGAQLEQFGVLQCGQSLFTGLGRLQRTPGDQVCPGQLDTTDSNVYFGPRCSGRQGDRFSQVVHGLGSPVELDPNPAALPVGERAGQVLLGRDPCGRGFFGFLEAPVLQQQVALQDRCGREQFGVCVRAGADDRQLSQSIVGPIGLGIDRR